MYNLPSPNDLFLLKECGYQIGDWVWVRPNSSDWSNDWYNIKLMVTAVSWHDIKKEWQFECIQESGVDLLYEVSMDDLTRYNMWE